MAPPERNKPKNFPSIGLLSITKNKGTINPAGYSLRNAQWRPKEHKRQIDDLINRISRLEERTRPHTTYEPENPKHLQAYVALVQAAELLNAVAGWAINHNIGLILDGLESPPLSAGTIRKNRTYQKLMKAASKHELESKGARLGFASLESRSARLGAAAILYPIATGLKNHALLQLANALEALEYGEVLEILEPVATKGKRNRITLSEMNIQMRALEFVEYQSHRKINGLSINRISAQEKVSSALGLGNTTLRVWKKRLKGKRGTIIVENRLLLAREAAVSLNEGRQAFLAEAFTDEALEKLSRQYRKLKKIKSAKSRAR